MERRGKLDGVDGQNRKGEKPSNEMLAEDEHDDCSLWRHKVSDIIGGRQTDLWERGPPIVLIRSAQHRQPRSVLALN